MQKRSSVRSSASLSFPLRLRNTRHREGKADVDGMPLSATMSRLSQHTLAIEKSYGLNRLFRSFNLVGS
jgi:hypothetical protein